METKEPCELIRLKDHCTVVLRPSLLQASWSEVDLFGEDIRRELDSRKYPNCVIDLSDLSYMGSSIVALIVRLWKDVQDRKGKFVVVCPHPTVAEVIRLAGLEKFWTVVPEIGLARKKLGLKNVLSDSQILKDTSVSQEVTVIQPPSSEGLQSSGNSPTGAETGLNSSPGPVASSSPAVSDSKPVLRQQLVSQSSTQLKSVSESVPPSLRILYFTLGALTVVVVLVGILLLVSQTGNK